MDYSIASGNGINPSTPLNGCIIDVRFCFAQYTCIKAVMYQDLLQLIGCIRNVRIESFFNVQCNNALFEFLFVMLSRKLDISVVIMYSIGLVLCSRK